MQRIVPVFLLFAAWSLISFGLYRAHIAAPPMGHHAWAMSDYYAMALRFQESGFDFFHPQTYNLRTKEGITGADLPLPAWLSALMMSWSGTDSMMIFRSLTWLAGCIGFYCFFLILLQRKIEPQRAALLTLFMALLPCWQYYNISALPTPWAWSAFLTGFWAIHAHLYATGNASRKHLIVGVAAFTLSALLRKPFILFFISAAIWWWARKKSLREGLIWWAGLVVWLLWQVYDHYLGKIYGNGFLRELMVPDSITNGMELAWIAIKKWGLMWLSPAHWLWLAGAIFLFFRNKNNKHLRSVSYFFFISFIAGVVYSFLMLRQFPDHDYYGIDAFYPAIFIGTALLAGQMPESRWVLGMEIVWVVLALIWSKFACDRYWDTAQMTAQETTNQAYRESEPFLSSIGVGDKAKMLVFEAYSDNAPLVGMKRTGYCLKSSRPALVQEALQQPWDYAICTDTFWVSEVLYDNPALIRQLTLKGRNKNLLVFERSKDTASTQPETLTGLSWKTLADTTLPLPENSEFLLSKTLSPLQSGTRILFCGNISTEHPASIKATVALFSKGEKVALAERPLNVQEAYCVTEIRVPHTNILADEMRIYLWNPEREKVRVGAYRILEADRIDPNYHPGNLEKSDR